ncbi:MAG TPA: TolC family protein [Longimicrobium sp.]|nr:TolC family protein [Longimicrobium sp.]
MTMVLLAPAAVRAQEGDGEPSPAAFWAALGDSTLERLVRDALGANRDLRAASARVNAARAGRTSAALSLAPVVSASSGYTRQRLAGASVPGAGGTLPDHALWDAGVVMSWEVDVFGRGRRTVQGRGALIQAAEHDVRDVQVLLAAEVARAYFDLRGARDRLAVARRNAENQRRSLQVTRDRLEMGSGTALDTERAQAQLSSTLAAIPALEAAIAAARNRIAVLLGRPPASLAGELGGEGRLPALPAAPAGAVTEVTARRRPDVRSAERQLAARTSLVAAARADYLPRVSISGVAATTATQLDALGNSGSLRYGVGPVVSWPLFDLGRVKARVDAARADEAEASARHEQAVLRALEEAETALVAYDRARERLRHLEEAAAASERATELARLRFEEGGTGFLEVLDAERTQLDAQDRLAAGRTEATLGLVAVYRALGGAWPRP